MKILHLLRSVVFTGAENVVLTLMKLFPEDETIYASPENEQVRKIVEENGQIFFPMEDYSMKSVKNVIKQVQPDIIHAHDFTMATTCAFAAGKIPVVAHLHNNPLWLQSFNPKSLTFALALLKIKTIISVSDSVQNEYCFGRLMQGKNTVIGNIVDLDEVKNRAEEYKIDQTFDLIALGRLAEPKNPVLFCEIVNRLKKILPDISAVMVGDGDLRGQVEEIIEKYGLTNNIYLAGFQENPYPYLKNSKVLVMPSIWEGFGLAAVEGLAMGKPVVCSGVGGLKDIVTSECGNICQEIEEYCNEIKQLLQDKDYYEAKSQNAQKQAEKFGNKEMYKREIERIYQKVQE